MLIHLAVKSSKIIRSGKGDENLIKGKQDQGVNDKSGRKSEVLSMRFIAEVKPPRWAGRDSGSVVEVLNKDALGTLRDSGKDVT